MTGPDARASGGRTPGTPVRDFPPETLCPSCGKFVGAYTRCPYCGCEHKLRMSIRFFRFFALAVSIGGLFLIWLAARGIKAPLVKVGDLGPMNSFAYVRIEGENVRTSAYDDGGISFVVDDGTGTIRVTAYTDTGKALTELGRIPGPGDRVSVEGTVQITEDRARLLVNVPEKVQVTRAAAAAAPAAAMEIGDVTHAAKGREVTVVGKITALLRIPNGLKLQLTDPTGAIDVVLWDSTRDRVTALGLQIEEGRFLKVRGHVGEYRGAIQVVPKSTGRVEETAVSR
jgi:DNA/RNA endonuclease YhcR with UshA esterase domain